MPKFSDIIGFTASRLHGFTASRLHGYCHILLAYHKNNSHTRLTRINKIFLFSREICEGVFFCPDLLLKDCELFCELGGARKNLLLKICGIFYKTCCNSLKKFYSIIHKNFYIMEDCLLWDSRNLSRKMLPTGYYLF